MQLLPIGLLASLFFAFSPANALQESDVGVVDWHKDFIGPPVTSSLATAPVFHRVGTKNTRSVVLTATESNVLGGLNPVDGEPRWRHIFDAEDHLVMFKRHENIVASLSGPGGATLRSFDVMTGVLLSEKHLHEPVTGLLTEPGHIGTDIAFHEGSAYTLTNGHTVTSMAGYGSVAWSWSSQDKTDSVIYSKLVISGEAIYAVGLMKSFASYSLHITSLSLATGEQLADVAVPSTVSDGLNGVVLLTDNVVWLDHGKLFKFTLTPTLDTASSHLSGEVYTSIVNVELPNHLVAVKSEDASNVITIKDGKLTSIWTFDSMKSPTPSLYSGGYDKDRRPYITRVYWSGGFNAASVECFAPHLGDGRGMVAGFSFPFDSSSHGTITHITTDTANPVEWQILVRVVLTTTTGAIEMWQQDKWQWRREEGLATLQHAKFVELPEQAALKVAEELNQSFGERLHRHLDQLQNLPTYLINFGKRFATGSYASAAGAASSSNGLSRDAFGFKQIILGASAAGKVYALDSSNGNILWSKLLSHGWASQIGPASMHPKKLFITKTATEGGPEAVLVVERVANNGIVDTVLFHFDALTGNAVDPEYQQQDKLLHGKDVLQGSATDVILLGEDGTDKVVVLVDDKDKVHLYPDAPASKQALTLAAPSLYIPHLDATGLVGKQLVTNPATGSSVHTAFQSWKLSLPPGETIVSVLQPSQQPIASLGKVLGNRTTLYKYLNPRLVLVTTQKSVYAVDAAKGTTVYKAEVPDGKDVQATLTENWLVYTYWSGEADKGYRIVSVEFYEGQGVDEKTKSSETSAFSELLLDLTAYEKSWAYPAQITAMGTTSTKYGISAKDLIVATNGNKIHSISRRFLDPRRPNRKPTSDEVEEQLLQYSPVVGSDPKRTVSHGYTVARTQNIVTVPSLLESTSLVFAHGLDLFLTRVAPSGTFDVLSESFNKAQLVFTITGLLVAIAITKPMVRRKKLKEKWYQ